MLNKLVTDKSYTNNVLIYYIDKQQNKQLPRPADFNQIKLTKKVKHVSTFLHM